MKSVSATSVPSEPKIGAWKGGWLLARASWSTLKLDREMLAFPFFSFVSGLVISAVFALAVWQSGFFPDFDVPSSELSRAQNIAYGAVFAVYMFCLMLASNIFSGAIIASALHRFKGNDPTVKYGLNQAMRRIKAITLFSLIASTVGLVLKQIENNTRIPLAGRIVAFFVDVAWNVAIVFTIPVLMANEPGMGPITAIRQSGTVFKKVWAKSFTGGLGLGLVSLAVVLPLLFISFVGMITGIMLGASLVTWIIASAIVAAWVGFIALFSALNGIFNAALYTYAETGEAPDKFDKRLLYQAFQPKKEWFK